MTTPIAIKDFGIDTDSGLNKQLIVYGMNINTDMERIELLYKIVLISPTGIQFEQSRGSYIRDNSTGAKNFDALRSSQLGQGITSDIESDLTLIKTFDSFSEDLIQK